MAKNFAQKMKTPALVEWEPKRPLTPHSAQYKQAALELAMRYMRAKPCIFCGGMDTPDSVGHHIYIRKKYSKLVATPQNIIPLCRKHHCSGHEFCAHPLNNDTQAAALFWTTLQRYMPNRLAEIIRLHFKDLPAGKHDYKSDFEFWVDVWKKDMDYEYVCKKLGIEAWPES